jgi:HSP20 family molecular chaperone IbpA
LQRITAMAQNNPSRHAFFTPALGPAAGRPWSPPVDIYRLADGWLLKFELAGVGPDDVSVSTDGRRIIVRGVRLDRCVGSGCSVHQMEITYTRFERAVELPESPDPTSVRCEFNHGMVLVRIYRAPSPPENPR